MSGAKPLFAVPYLAQSESGAVSLVGVRCGACGEPYLGERSVCARCHARDAMIPAAFGDTGRLYSFTTVHRSFPGVRTPFVMAIVDLDDGPSVRGTLVGVPPDASTIAFDMQVRVVARETDQRHGDGRPYLSFSFVPAMTEQEA